MRAVTVEVPGKANVHSVPDPTPGLGEVLVQVVVCGICGTDLHIIDGEFPPAPYPIIPGHEFAGTVAALGPGVDQFTVGDRVAVDPSLFCGLCPQCRAGRGNLCSDWGAIGDTVNGALAEYVTVPVANAYLLPEKISLREGALVEPLSCAVHGISQLGSTPSGPALVIGAGTMGLLVAQLLGHAGAGPVSIIDRNDGRLAVAEQLGLGPTAADIRMLPATGFEVAVDATGSPAAIEAAFDSLGQGGKLLIFGVASAQARVSLSPFQIYNKEISVIGSMAVLHSFGKAVELLSRGVIDTSVLTRDRYPLEQFTEAITAVRRGTTVGTKVQIIVNEDWTE